MAGKALERKDDDSPSAADIASKFDVLFGEFHTKPKDDWFNGDASSRMDQGAGHVPKRAPAQRNDRRKHLIGLALFIGMSAVAIVALHDRKFDFGWRTWLLWAGAFLIPILAAIYLVALSKGWSTEQSEQAYGRVFGWMFTALFLIAAVAYASLIFFSIGSWLATIPSWAAVIIILLLVKIARD